MPAPRRTPLAPVLALLLASCGILDPAAQLVAKLEVVGGGTQVGQVATLLPQLVVVRAVDSLNAPVPGVGITWQVESGQLESDSVTDAEGYARAKWTLGRVAGRPRGSASAKGVTATFGATAQPGPVARIRRIAGDGQSATEGAVLPDSLVVSVADSLDNPIPGVRVDWKVSRGGGTIRAPAPSLTGPNGRAAAVWQVGIALPNAAFAVVGKDTVPFSASPSLLSPRDTVRADSLLSYLDIRIASDTATARPGTMVSVFYAEYLLDGTLLQRVRRGVDAPLRFVVGADGVIPGFDRGVRGMRKGSLRRLIVPPALGYRDGVVRVYDVELAEIARAP